MIAQDHMLDKGDSLLGKFLGDDTYDVVVKEDCDVFKPDGSLLLSFRKNVIPLDVCRAAYQGLRSAAQPSNNRGMAAGEFDKELIAPHFRNKKVIQHGNGYRPVNNDGTLSNTVYYNQVESGIVGYMDRSTRFPFCRQTAWTEKNFKQFNGATAIVRKIDTLFQKYVPLAYAEQRACADRCSKDFIIKGTAFSTLTVNKNYRTAGHRDAGDYPKGFGNITVLEAGKYLGAYTIFPRYRVAVDVRMGDACFMDVHEVHGNSPFIGKKGQYERISLVCYLREKMAECGTVHEELERVKRAR